MENEGREKKNENNEKKTAVEPATHDTKVKK